MRLLTEAALSRRIVTGDDRAFAELFRRHRQALYGYCLSVLGDQEDAADALQNTMAKALKSLPGENRELNLKAWLFRVAHNECVDMLRARRRMDDIEEHSLKSASRVEGSVIARERLGQVLADLRQLPERQRGALVMRELNGMSFAEIAAVIDSSPAAAKQVVYEARCALQEQAQGRDMDCESVRRVLSERDGRKLKGRRIRAHLRTCDGCSDFKAGIESRRGDLRSLIPPIPAAVALSILDMFGGSGGTGGVASLLGIGGGGKAAISGGAMKAVAAVAVTAGVGAGTLGVVEGTRHAGEPGDRPPAKVVPVAPIQRLPTSSHVPPPASMVAGTDSPAGGSNRSENHLPRSRDDRNAAVPGDRPKEVEGPIPGNSGGPDSKSPDTSGDVLLDHPGGSGGAQGKGAIPTHGGRPTELPSASAHGQAQAGAHANPASAVVNPGKSGKPASTAPPVGVGGGKGSQKKSETAP